LIEFRLSSNAHEIPAERIAETDLFNNYNFYNNLINLIQLNQLQTHLTNGLILPG
jgi:hypothetical protein